LKEAIVSLDGTDAQSQKWLSDEGLAELYKDFPLNKMVYIYCHDGFRMSLAYLQFKHLGVKAVRLYSRGWPHWGNKLTLPVVEGDKPYSGDYEL
jgi:thiosulfate/3-mercaptopyruvate sulfurtransferase